MVRGRFCLLPEKATALLSAFRRDRGESSFERAESFGSLLTGSGPRSTRSSRPQVVFHLDLVSDAEHQLVIGNKCSQAGTGPVSRRGALEVLEEASRVLVGTIDNKLTWFSEQDRRSTSVLLPDFVKRAVLANSRSQCACKEVATDVDHITARINEGVNDFSNLQALCGQCHHAKTRHDAPWTQGGIYAKAAEKRKAKKERKEVAMGRPDVLEELFPDTG